MTVLQNAKSTIHLVESGEMCGKISSLCFRDPKSFKAGELHKHVSQWEWLTEKCPGAKDGEVLNWIQNGVSVWQYFQHFKGSFKGEEYDSDLPPKRIFTNNASCKQFTQFIETTLLDRLKTGAISILGKVGVVEPPHVVLPLTVEPSKPRLCLDARYVNLWICDMPFNLDRLSDVPRYVGKDSFQTVLDDKSGYDHILLTKESRMFFGMQWGGWYFSCNTIPFGWKTSAYIYHTTGLMATNYFRSIGIPCSLYIDDRHNGQLQVPLGEGAYKAMTKEERFKATSESALFLVAFHLVQLGYFLGIQKSILSPRQSVPYLGFIIDSKEQCFRLIPRKKQSFIDLVKGILGEKSVCVKVLQRLAGKCVSLSLAVPAAKLFTREMNGAISRGLKSCKDVRIEGKLREEIQYWLFLETWDEPFPWRSERHTCVRVATDASGYGWGATIQGLVLKQMSDYWSNEEKEWDIAVKEATAIDRLLCACEDLLRNTRVDASVDSRVVIDAWNAQGGRSSPLNTALKRLFHTTLRLNVVLKLSFVASEDNPADFPSRRLSMIDCTLSKEVWSKVDLMFGGTEGHSCDLMALDSNVMKDRHGKDLPHYTPWRTPGSRGVNIFVQDLTSKEGGMLARPYVFPPLVLVGPVLSLLTEFGLSCTVVVLDVFPRKYWWPALWKNSTRRYKLASKGDVGSILAPSKGGWVPHQNLPGDLWVFSFKP